MGVKLMITASARHSSNIYTESSAGLVRLTKQIRTYSSCNYLQTKLDNMRYKRLLT